ncbi:hypothetical protein CBM2626_B130111 [Cupriavidus taiwanensis]|nr:hypothetical protein CBM2626_B130111 [Cupriavidus taiwanensis]
MPLAARKPAQLALDEPQAVRLERMQNKQMVQELLRAAVQKFQDTTVQGVSEPNKVRSRLRCNPVRSAGRLCRTRLPDHGGARAPPHRTGRACRVHRWQPTPAGRVGRPAVHPQ